ncbi:MAG TPA: cupredoxin domain-containing protein [Polyangiaceae bacterium]|nr:cupredoxin domain-containing protein [Polyangiaceae bacterium]
MPSSTLVKAALVLSLAGVACSRSEPSPTATPAPAPAAELHGTPDDAGRLSIEVTDQGFVPAKGTVKVGKPVTLVITRKVQKTCATDIVISEYQVNKPLPLNETVEVTFTPQKPGKIHFACPMDMITGDLTAE